MGGQSLGELNYGEYKVQPEAFLYDRWVAMGQTFMESKREGIRVNVGGYEESEGIKKVRKKNLVLGRTKPLG